MSSRLPEVVLVRHGETEWSRAGKHTGRTDVPLTDAGREQAAALAASLRGRNYALVLTSPLSRASETSRLAGCGDVVQERADLQEWDYGTYEGRTTAEIRDERPDWSLWRDGVPHGETVAEVGVRADRVIAELRAAAGDAVVFAHGHLLRVLAARWLGLDPSAGRLLALDTATISVLGYERETAVVRRWNVEPPALASDV
jgi:broad specificity phosphatase PhoE